jgi:RNA polymerase sigma factor (sigma-70 family)
MSEGGATLQALISFQDDAYRFAFRLTGNAVDAEDAVQEAFLRVARVGGPSPDLERRRWFLGLVASCSTNLKRADRSRRKREREAGVIMSQEDSSSPTENKNLSEVKLALAKAMNALDQNLRVPVSLRYEQGLPYEDAAEILNMSEGTVRDYVSRGLKKLRETLARQGYAIAPSFIVATLGEGFGIHAPPSLTAALNHIAQTGKALTNTGHGAARVGTRPLKSLSKRSTRRAVKAKSGGSAVFVGAAIAAAVAVTAVMGLFANSSRPVKSLPTSVAVATVKAPPAPVAVAPVIGLAKEIVLDLGGGVKMELVLVKAGEFNMGSNNGEENEKPVHRVKISQSYYIGKYDVTVAQFRVFADATKFPIGIEKFRGWTVSDGKWQAVSGVNWLNPGFKQEDNHPVVVLNWYDAQAFCKWATETTGRRVRLPTEAEWEYAARGPKSLKYPWGDKWEGIMANVADASLRRAGFNMQWGEIEEDDGYPFTSPGGAYKNASWCGAYDMAGNVWQWCQDYFNDKYYGESPVVDPQGPANGDDRVRRGGGWANAPDDCRSARRHKLYHCDASTGFRVVVECGSSRHP